MKVNWNWIALNESSYADYQKAEVLAERIRILESTLVSNILIFARGIGWEVDKKVEARVLDIGKANPVKVKQVRMLAFNLSFETNVFLPNYIGLGKKVSRGFGTIKQLRENRSRTYQN